jgi:hypothetical protein
MANSESQAVWDSDSSFGRSYVMNANAADLGLATIPLLVHATDNSTKRILGFHRQLLVCVVTVIHTNIYVEMPVCFGNMKNLAVSCWQMVGFGRSHQSSSMRRVIRPRSSMINDDEIITHHLQRLVILRSTQRRR